MDDAKIIELHRQALPIAEKVRVLEAELATWRNKQDIQVDLVEARKAHRAIVLDIAGVCSEPVEGESDDAE